MKIFSFVMMLLTLASYVVSVIIAERGGMHIGTTYEYWFDKRYRLPYCVSLITCILCAITWIVTLILIP